MENLTFLGLAEQVLTEEMRPLTPHEIWAVAVSRGYDQKLRSKIGKTPSSTLYSALVTDIQSEKSKFIKATEGPARYSLKQLWTRRGHEMNKRPVDPAAPPNLSYSVIHTIKLSGRLLPPRMNYWNRLLVSVIVEAAKTLTSEEVLALGTSMLAGKHRGRGFLYVPELDISVQAQNANLAWRATYEILRRLKLPAEIEFGWQVAGQPPSYERMVVEWAE